MTPRPRKRRRFALIIAASALTWLFYTAARSRVLLAQGRAIEIQSAQFPRDYFVGQSSAPQLKYLAMGDSTAAGWGAGSLSATYPYLVAQTLAARGYRVQVRNVAVGGAKAGDITAQLPALQTFAPDVITLSVGANDATHFTSPAEFGSAMQTLIAALERSSARSIAVANTPDMFLAPALPLPLSVATARRARAQNAVLPSLVSRAHIVDLYGHGKLNARVNPDFYAADRFHPGAAGYAKWAPLFAEKLTFEGGR